ncbi:MAG: TetR/AcrR family transcriptional regulator [Solobacterium sp.]|jgi:AcrR family transcriptional regulator|nr:TetR/AcrR family transcriptional regulator [Solobacterium sp.]
MSKTDPRIIKTLRHIDEALLECLKENEFRKITVDMLCRKALINRSTFYKYYADKYELLNNYLDRVLSEFSEAMATTDFILATPSTIANQQYIDNFRRSIDYVYDHRQIYRILWEASIDRPIYQEMEDIIRRNILGTIRRNSAKDQPITPYHDLYAELFASNLMTLVRWWLANDTTVSREDVEALMNSNMKNGLFSTFKYRI